MTFLLLEKLATIVYIYVSNFCWLLVTTEFQLNNSATAANIQVCSHEIHFNRWFGLQVGLQIKECNFWKIFLSTSHSQGFHAV